MRTDDELRAWRDAAPSGGEPAWYGQYKQVVGRTGDPADDVADPTLDGVGTLDLIP